MYADDDETETHFSRVIQGSASDYRINGRVSFVEICMQHTILVLFVVFGSADLCVCLCVLISLLSDVVSVVNVC